MKQDRKTVTLALLGTFLIIAAHKGTKGKFPEPRVMVALAFVFLVLGFLVEFAPKLAAAFAALVFVSVLLSQGSDVLKKAQKELGR